MQAEVGGGKCQAKTETRTEFKMQRTGQGWDGGSWFAVAAPKGNQHQEKKDKSILFVIPSFRSQLLSSLGNHRYNSPDVHLYNPSSHRGVCCSVQKVTEKSSLCSPEPTNIVYVANRFRYQFSRETQLRHSGQNTEWKRQQNNRKTQKSGAKSTTCKNEISEKYLKYLKWCQNQFIWKNQIIRISELKWFIHQIMRCLAKASWVLNKRHLASEMKTLFANNLA